MTVHDITEYDVEQLEELCKKLILQVYYEFVYKQRDQKIWEVGMETIQKIGE
jgi:hypothetical protein